MKNWFEHDGDERANRNARRDRMLIAAAVIFLLMIAIIPNLL